ncbi:hypothetical protein TGME49_272730 [Toxoplasma gondii ME49]|uniref:Uncharacterized protein n=2 Tax=Toxoplasma gondii TaxID=5811 RepID=S8GJE6_TOXGM|nr:hypothetical protein TGME49_272730 [Toxoplasma gondii ME49]EPT28614.1 hypothetical protein TGME49_272730 [Toxoplasma gondii ME49]KYF46504.1 hypothetical protein TGARI_272730 [Toxoplasma gondii ARI]|eukprot:XP_002365905.1 hypothetical protein TGME49_272730 [Toxoplasma gondii ME49]
MDANGAFLPTLLSQERVDRFSSSSLPSQNSTSVYAPPRAFAQTASFPSSFSSYQNAHFPTSSFPPSLPASSLPPASFPPPPASPSPLTLRDFLQLLGESVAVLEGLRLLLLQLLQWGGEVGSVIRASTFLHKFLSLLARLLRFLLSPLSRIWQWVPFLLVRKQSAHDQPTREPLPPSVSSYGDRRAGNSGILPDAQSSRALAHTFQNAWRSAGGVHTPWGAYRSSQGWYGSEFADAKSNGDEADYNSKSGAYFQAIGTERKSGRGRFPPAWRTSVTGAAWLWRGRSGVVVYSALVLVLAYKLHSLWKKYGFAATSLRKKRNDLLLASSSQEAASSANGPSVAACADASASSSFSSSSLSTTPGAEEGREMLALETEAQKARMDRLVDGGSSLSLCSPQRSATNLVASEGEKTPPVWKLDASEAPPPFAGRLDRRSSSASGGNGEEATGEKESGEDEKEKREGDTEEEGEAAREEEREDEREDGRKEERKEGSDEGNEEERNEGRDDKEPTEKPGECRVHTVTCDELEALHLRQQEQTDRLNFHGETRGGTACDVDGIASRSVRIEKLEETSSSSDACEDPGVGSHSPAERYCASPTTASTAPAIFADGQPCGETADPPSSVHVPFCEDSSSTLLLKQSASSPSSTLLSSAFSAPLPSSSSSSRPSSCSSSAASSPLLCQPDDTVTEGLVGRASETLPNSGTEVSGVCTRLLGTQKRTTPAFEVNPFLSLLSSTDPEMASVSEKRDPAFPFITRENTLPSSNLESAFPSLESLTNWQVQPTFQTGDRRKQQDKSAEDLSKTSVATLSYEGQGSSPPPQTYQVSSSLLSPSPASSSSDSSPTSFSSSSALPSSSSSTIAPLSLPHTPLPSFLPLSAFLPSSTGAVLGEVEGTRDYHSRLIFGDRLRPACPSLPENPETSSGSLEELSRMTSGLDEGRGAGREEGVNSVHQKKAKKSSRKRSEGTLGTLNRNACVGRSLEAEKTGRIRKKDKGEDPDLRATAESIWRSQQEDLRALLGVCTPQQGRRDIRRVR